MRGGDGIRVFLFVLTSVHAVSTKGRYRTPKWKNRSLEIIRQRGGIEGSGQGGFKEILVGTKDKGILLGYIVFS